MKRQYVQSSQKAQVYNNQEVIMELREALTKDPLKDFGNPFILVWAIPLSENPCPGRFRADQEVILSLERPFNRKYVCIDGLWNLKSAAKRTGSLDRVLELISTNYSEFLPKGPMLDESDF